MTQIVKLNSIHIVMPFVLSTRHLRQFCKNKLDTNMKVTPVLTLTRLDICRNRAFCNAFPMNN